MLHYLHAQHFTSHLEALIPILEGGRLFCTHGVVDLYVCCIRAGLYCVADSGSQSAVTRRIGAVSSIVCGAAC